MDVFEAYSRQDPSAHLLLIGDGKLRSEIEKNIAEKGLRDRVLVLGKRADVDKLYQSMDVFVLPSLWEGLPVTLVEAQTAGLQCVVSNTVTREVNITGNIQYLGIGPEDVETWVNALQSIRQENRTRFGWSNHIVKSVLNIANSVDDLLGIYGSAK